MTMQNLTPAQFISKDGAYTWAQVNVLPVVPRAEVKVKRIYNKGCIKGYALSVDGVFMTDKDLTAFAKTCVLR